MTTFAGHLLKGTHAARPAATAVPAGSPLQLHRPRADLPVRRRHLGHLRDLPGAPTPPARVVELKIMDDATTVTTGDGKLVFAIPSQFNGLNLTDADAFVTTVSSSGCRRCRSATSPTSRHALHPDHDRRERVHVVHRRRRRRDRHRQRRRRDRRPLGCRRGCGRHRRERPRCDPGVLLMAYRFAASDFVEFAVSPFVGSAFGPATFALLLKRTLSTAQQQDGIVFASSALVERAQSGSAPPTAAGMCVAAPLPGPGQGCSAQHSGTSTLSLTAPPSASTFGTGQAGVMPT